MIKHMVQRFLGWKLPEDFRPDAGISFKPTFNEHTAHPGKHEPSGTNLLDATQAEAMARYLLDGLPAAAPSNEAWRSPYFGLTLPDLLAEAAEIAHRAHAFNTAPDLRAAAEHFRAAAPRQPEGGQAPSLRETLENMTNRARSEIRRGQTGWAVLVQDAENALAQPAPKPAPEGPLDVLRKLKAGHVNCGSSDCCLSLEWLDLALAQPADAATLGPSPDALRDEALDALHEWAKDVWSKPLPKPTDRGLTDAERNALRVLLNAGRL